jgi:hypothetical protein
MNVDHFFTIGSGHQTQGTPCEDYALSGTLANGTAFGVVADGCSGANANTDVGARAIAWAFKRSLERRQVDAGRWFLAGFPELLQDVFHEHQYAGAREDYLATLVGFAATPDDASVYVHGDGAIALKYADGGMRLIQLTWWDNMPFYLNYRLHLDLLDQFASRYQDGIIEPFVQRTTTFRTTDAGLEILDSQAERFQLDSVFTGHVLHFRPADEGIVAMAVLTDGIEQVGENPAAEVASEFMAFKNHQGEFVKRRMLKALKTFRKDALIPRDDVGIAAVWFPKEA